MLHKTNNLISIIMPAYNCEKYIKEAILSVLKQSYKLWELIIIDDCSSDKTVDIVRECINYDSRIKLYINKSNQGVSLTRNKGISLAKGKWIAFLDSDDMWENTKLEKQISLANNTGAKFIFTGASYINEEGKYYSGIFEVPEKVTYNSLKRQNVISCSSVLVKSSFFTDIKMENDDMHEDYAVWLRILKTGIDAYSVNEPLLIYRISSKSKSGNKLKTLKMTYKVFRFIELSRCKSVYFTISHVVRSINKYKKISGK